MSERPVELTVNREVAAPARRVWDIVTDLDGSPAVLSNVQGVERLDDDRGFELGTRWRESRTMFGKQTTEEMEVTVIDPPRRYTVVSDDGRATYTSTIAVTPLADERCRLEMSFAGQPAGLVGRVLAATLGRLFLGATRKMLQRDLDDIATHAEASTTGD